MKNVSLRSLLLIVATLVCSPISAQITVDGLPASPELRMPPDEVAREVGRRLVALTIPKRNDGGVVEGFVSGSGYMLNKHEAITAAHVVRHLSIGDPMVVQVGALREGHNQLTVGRLLRVDERRDLAIVDVELEGAGSAVDHPEDAAEICNGRVPENSGYWLGGLSKATASGRGLERLWTPIFRQDVLSPLGAPSIDGHDALGYWRDGDPVILLGYSANPGDSGGAVLGARGCLMGIISLIAPVKVPVDGIYERPTFVVPILPDDKFIRNYR